MKIEAFQVEEWMNAYETKATYNIAETCVDSISLNELFRVVGANPSEFWERFSARRLTYGDIVGKAEFLQGVCSLYQTLSEGQIIPTHGAAGANHLLVSALVESGDHVVSVMPTYQQLYAIPRALEARVNILHLRKEDGYLPDLDALRSMVTEQTKLICINNPNNPTGALMKGDMLREIVEIARACGAYLHCDEVYRHLNQDDIYVESIADLYEKGISTSSMSKVFSLAGLRIGWIATQDAAARTACLSHRDYCHISSGLFDEEVSAIALANAGELLARNRTLIRENLLVLDAWVAQEPHISYVRPEAGTTALLEYDFDMDSFAFCTRLLEEHGALLTPGDCFEQPRSARIGYACKTEELTQGLEALHHFLQSL